MESAVKISLNEKESKTISEVRIDGVIDTITAGEVEQIFDSLSNRSRYKIIVDLAGVNYISSAGWGIFISRIKEARSNEGDIKLANLTEDVYEIYELLEFENVLKTFESLDSARVDFGSPISSSGPRDNKKKSSKTKLD